MRIDLLTLFPEAFSVLNSSILKRAQEKSILELNIIDFRQYSQLKSKRVDDVPYGGGVGMILSPGPIVSCLRSVKGSDSAYKIITAPRGKRYVQSDAKRLAEMDHLVIICGHYEGIDERVYDYVDEAISLGDFILTGGEIAAAALVDSITRLLDGVINEQSLSEESFTSKLLEHPQYTRPEDFEGKKVPKLLLSGNHAKIDEYRKNEAIRLTKLYRPDLLDEEEK